MAVATVPRPGAPALSPEDPAAVAVRTAVRFYLRGFAAAEEGTRAGEVEAVHQLRVSTRRLRATLALFGPLLAKRLVDVSDHELTWLGRAIGAVRDLDVLAEAVAARAARLDPELRRALAPLTVAIDERRIAEHAILVASLGAPRCRRLGVRLAAFAESRPPAGRAERLGEVAPNLVRPLLRRVLRVGRQLDAGSPAEELHRLRVRVKRLRYALEKLQGPEDKAVRRTIRRLVRLQDVLGQHQDAVTQIAWLRRWVESTPLAPSTVLAVGALIQLLVTRARKRRRRFAEAWERFDRPRRHRRLAAELTPAPGGQGAPLAEAAGR